MPSQFKFFLIPARSLEDEELLNRFLLHQRVLTVQREFVQDWDNSFWSLAVEHLAGESKTTGHPSCLKEQERAGKSRVTS